MDTQLQKDGPGFLFRSPKVIIMVEGKGQTRGWLIIAPLPAGRFIIVIISILVRIVRILLTMHE